MPFHFCLWSRNDPANVRIYRENLERLEPVVIQEILESPDSRDCQDPEEKRDCPDRLDLESVLEENYERNGDF